VQRMHPRGQLWAVRAGSFRAEVLQDDAGIVDLSELSHCLGLQAVGRGRLGGVTSAARCFNQDVAMFPQLARLSDLGFLLLRLMVGVVFITSGWNDLKDPAARSKSVGLSKGFTMFLGAAEVAGSLGVMFGVLTQLAALGLVVVMLGAIQKKIFVWHTGFWGEKAQGWHYDLMLVVMNLVIIFTGGGRWVLLR
jgi:putative oxidoreductase